MPQTISRLTLGRTVGEAVLIGGSLLLTVTGIDTRKRLTKVNLRDESMGINEDKLLFGDDVLTVCENVGVAARSPTGGGRQVRLTFHAPRDITLMRTELLDGKRLPALPRPGGDATP